jgi:mitochondrial fission protein ELM1
MSIAWVLQDNRAGNNTQTKALAESLKLDYICKKIEYNAFAKFPSSILGVCLFHVVRSRSDDITNNLPDVIISAGRRLAIVAHYIKRHKPSLKTIHIMRPFYKEDSFDYLIVPNHDNCTKPNAISILGALNDAKNQITKAAPLENFFGRFGQCVGVVIGGKSQRFDFTPLDIEILIMQIRKFLQQTNLVPVITFSRRTSQAAKKSIKLAFPNAIVYDPVAQANQPNIYYSILKSAKFIICTADSISMCSEVASSGKPFYIYIHEHLGLSTRHINFINQLFSLKIARQLGDNVEIEQYDYLPLNEIARVAEIIRL